MVETVTDIIVARSREPEGLKTMIVWSMAAHIALLAAALLWGGPRVNEAPRTVMTISLSGAPGPDTGGKTQAGDQSTPPPPTPEPVKPAAPAPPAAKPPEMILPSPRRPRTPPPKAAPAQAPTEATAKTANSAPQSPPRPRGQGLGTPGTGLSSSGGSGGAVTLDVTDFCCQEYLDQMAYAIRQNWDQNQGLVGSTTMQFVISRNGTIQSPQVEKSSGFVALDNAALRALQLSRLAPLPAQFENPTLTVHLRFDFQR